MRARWRTSARGCRDETNPDAFPSTHRQRRTLPRENARRLFEDCPGTRTGAIARNAPDSRSGVSSPAFVAARVLHTPASVLHSPCGKDADPLNTGKQRFKKGRTPNRSREHRSPLDRLPLKVQRELARRCVGHDTLAEICNWLAEKHGLKISDTSISIWRKRKVSANHTAISQTVWAGGFEITVVAPGASTITLSVKPAHSTSGPGRKR